MSIKLLTPPSTLKGIKNLAKRIGRDQKIPHHDALDVAAQSAGYENFNHAKNTIEQGPIPHRMIYLTSYWSDVESGESGRITIGVPLNRPVGDFLKPHQVRGDNRYIAGFKLEFTDHLEAIHDDSQSGALQNLKAAARTIQLMECTGLRGARHDFPKNVIPLFRKLRGADHTSAWSVPGNPEKWVVIDEPYNIFDREAWAKAFGLHAATARWIGLHLGGVTITTVFTATESYTNEIFSVLKKIAANDQNLITLNASYDSVFTSPARAAARKVRKPRPMPVKPGVVKGSSIAYGGMPGERTEWRPARPLSISMHREIGPRIEAVGDSGIPSKAYPALLSVKFTLQSWFYEEHGKDLSDEDRAAYYDRGESSRKHQIAETLTDAAAKFDAIDTVIMILTTGYPDCPPLRTLIKRLKLVAGYIHKGHFSLTLP